MTRKTISLTLSISFLLLLLLSVVLYIVPEGRVAYWSDWTFLGLSKSQWGNLHIATGLLFLITGLWHLVLNWRCIIVYIKNSLSKAKGVIKPWPVIIALLVNLFFFAGTLWGWQPMKQILAWNSQIKAYQARENGNPPYGHAELSSLESFCGFLGFDKEYVIEALNNDGLQGDITLKTTIIDIARANKMTPQNVYDKIMEAVKKAPVKDVQEGEEQSVEPTQPKGSGNGGGAGMKQGASPGMGEGGGRQGGEGNHKGATPQGLGRMQLSQVCSTYGYDLDAAIKILSAEGIKATGDKTLKEIANENGILPSDVYEKIQKVAK